MSDLSRSWAVSAGVLAAAVALAISAFAEPSPASPPPAAPAVPSTATPAADPANATPVDPAAPILRGTTVLHIGDSFAAAGFVQSLKPRLKALGVRYEVKVETSSFTTSWTQRMPKLIQEFSPDLVIINLGANEVHNVDPTAHAPAVHRIVEAIGARPCVWVSAPSWGPETGITEVIREHSAPCRFFDSDQIVKRPIPRQRDGIHPTIEGGALWADAFWEWTLRERDASGQAPDGSKRPWLLRPSPAGEHLRRVH